MYFNFDTVIRDVYNVKKIQMLLILMDFLLILISLFTNKINKLNMFTRMIMQSLIKSNVKRESNEIILIQISGM